MLTQSDYNLVKSDTLDIADEYSIHYEFLEDAKLEAVAQVKLAYQLAVQIANATTRYHAAVDKLQQYQSAMHELGGHTAAKILTLNAYK